MLSPRSARSSVCSPAGHTCGSVAPGHVGPLDRRRPGVAFGAEQLARGTVEDQELARRAGRHDALAHRLEHGLQQRLAPLQGIARDVAIDERLEQLVAGLLRFGGARPRPLAERDDRGEQSGQGQPHAEDGGRQVRRRPDPEAAA